LPLNMTQPYKLLLSGSLIEGQSGANHFCHDNKLQDIDLMIEIGSVTFMDQLELLNSAPGFVHVRSADETELNNPISYSAHLLNNLYPLPTEMNFLMLLKSKKFFKIILKMSWEPPTVYHLVRRLYVYREITPTMLGQEEQQPPVTIHELPDVVDLRKTIPTIKDLHNWDLA
ncbi:unnamed protein product, partial [Didymodactylos carnosus]